MQVILETFAAYTSVSGC